MASRLLFWASGTFIRPKKRFYEYLILTTVFLRRETELECAVMLVLVPYEYMVSTED